MKWKRRDVYRGYEWSTDGATVTRGPGIYISKDPRTGKPWKSMKAAREWFDEMQELCKEIYKP
jgi:hypothetical protein